MAKTTNGDTRRVKKAASKNADRRPQSVFEAGSVRVGDLDEVRADMVRAIKAGTVKAKFESLRQIGIVTKDGKLSATYRARGKKKQ